MVRRNALLLWFCFLAVSGSLNVDSDFASVQKQASKIRGDIIGWRRALHSEPELMYQEHKTSKYIQGVLDSLGISFTAGWANNTRQDRIPGVGGTGVVADIGSGTPVVALRADIDALPIEEQIPSTTLPFRSQHAGRMHACGHDGHTSMLLGAAKLLKEVADELPGTVRLIFQPAEEGGAGAKRMREEGVLLGVSRLFGLHVWPALPSGSIGGRAGVTMAAADFFELDIVGKGGHGAMPHLGVDPVVAAAAVVQSLQSLVSRETDPRDSAVLSVTMLHAGDAFNVIPAKATLGGTIRALSEASLSLLRKRMLEVVESVATAHRCSLARFKFQPDPYPPTVNDPALWHWLGSPEVGIGKNGVAMHWDMEPTMGGEDFSFFAQDVPGAFVFLGQGSGKLEDSSGAGQEKYPTNTTVHSPRYVMDESVLDLGTALHAHFALRSLSSLRGSGSMEL